MNNLRVVQQCGDALLACEQGLVDMVAFVEFDVRGYFIIISHGSSTHPLRDNIDFIL